MKQIIRHSLIGALAAGLLTACGGGETADTVEPTEDTAMSEDLSATDNMAMGANTTGPVMVGGKEMFANKNIVENASQSADHTTLVSAVKAAGLAETLSGPGPYTVFAPTNAAFEKLPAGTVDNLVKPESKQALTGILTYHVVPGRMTAAELTKAIEAGGGTASLKTVAGGNLTATQSGGTITLKDAKGGTAQVTQGDVMQSNGVIHVVDTVLMPS